MTPQDRELWEYFATLYKNSNKGIKGRGKDRKISSTKSKHNSADGREHPSGSDDDRKHSGSYEDSYNDGSSSDEE
jgi:hypothetical protein